MNRRQFSVRVEYSGQSELVEFWKEGYDDFELRQGDEAVIVCWDGKVREITNCTIKRTYKVAEPSALLPTLKLVNTILRLTRRR